MLLRFGALVGDFCENNKGRGQNLSLFVQLLFAICLTDLFKAWYNGLLLKVAGLFLCLSLC